MNESKEKGLLVRAISRKERRDIGPDLRLIT
jgi:hypothetical protein